MARRIEGYAIVSQDGMLANAAGVMPEPLKFDADKKFFERGLDGVGVVVHGRHSHEQQPHSDRRKRLILTRDAPGISVDPAYAQAWFWNPARATFDEALTALDARDAAVGIIGGTAVFGMFLGLYDVFYLTHAPGVKLPGGRPVFPGIPAQTPEDIMTANGLRLAETQTLDAAKNLMVASWRRAKS